MRFQSQRPGLRPGFRLRDAPAGVAASRPAGLRSALRLRSRAETRSEIAHVLEEVEVPERCEEFVAALHPDDRREQRASFRILTLAVHRVLDAAFDREHFFGEPA